VSYEDDRERGRDGGNASPASASSSGLAPGKRAPSDRLDGPRVDVAAASTTAPAPNTTTSAPLPVVVDALGLAGDITGRLLPGYRLAVDMGHAAAQLELGHTIIGAYRQIRTTRDQLDEGDGSGDADAYADDVAHVDAVLVPMEHALAWQLGPQTHLGQPVIAAAYPTPLGRSRDGRADQLAAEVIRVGALLATAQRVMAYFPDQGAGHSERVEGDAAATIAQLVTPWRSRPVDLAFLVAVLRTAGVWHAIESLPGVGMRTLGDVDEAARAQAGHTGALGDVGDFDADQVAGLVVPGGGDQAGADEVFRMLVTAQPNALGGLVVQLSQMGRLDAVLGPAVRPRAHVQALHDRLPFDGAPSNKAARRLLTPILEAPIVNRIPTDLMTGGLAPAIEFDAEPGGRSNTGRIDNAIAESNSALAQRTLRTLRFAYHATSMDFAAEHDATYDQLAAGDITAGDFVDAKGTAIAKAWAVGGVSAATGGAFGAYGAGLAKALGPRAMVIAEGAIGGMAGGITGAATADAFDVATGAKDAGDVSGWDWGRAGFYGAAFGAGLSATGVLSSEAARHLPGKRTLGQDLAIRHPQHAGLFDELRLLGERDAVVVHTTLRKLQDWIDAGLLPPGSAGPALAVAGGGQLGDDAAIALTIEATAPLNQPGIVEGPAPVRVLEARTLDGEVLPASESQAPYSPRRTRDDFEATHDEVTSSTVPKRNGKNVKLAGERHPVTGIPFDERGFAILDDIAVFEAQLPSSVSSVRNRKHHMRAATRQLHDAIERGEASASMFDENQLAAIAAGKDKIPGFTWHHHQHVGRMQLVPEIAHGETGHMGGMDTWFGGT
jgi:hypothetical protein